MADLEAAAVPIHLTILAELGDPDTYPDGLNNPVEQALFDLENDPVLFWTEQVHDWWETT